MCDICKGNHFVVVDGEPVSCVCIQGPELEETPLSKIVPLCQHVNEWRASSPTKKGNVRCMDCRCGGYGCPGMPPSFERRIMDQM